MNKRIVSCLLILALLLPVGSAFAVSTIGDVHLNARPGQTITLTAAAFTDRLTLDPADAGAVLSSITFPTLPAANQAVIRLDGADYVADTPVPLSAISAGDLQIRLEAAKGVTVRIPFRGALSNGTTMDASLDIGVAPEALDASHVVRAGSAVQISLGVRDRVPGAIYTFTLIGDTNLQHGTLRAGTGVGVFYYDAISAGTDTFQFTVTLNGVTSAPATVTVTVEPLDIVFYRDMPTHWAAHSAGRLAFLDMIIGQQADKRFYFFPDRGITRGDFVIWLCAVMGIEPTTNPATLYADTDIPGWMKGFLEAATREGIIQGVPARSPATTSYFFPHNPVTRIEAIRMISIALGVEGHDDDLVGLFHDIAAIPGWGKNNVRHLSELRIITGDPSGNLHPMRNLTRGEAAEMLYRAYKEMQLPTV